MAHAKAPEDALILGRPAWHIREVCLRRDPLEPEVDVKPARSAVQGVGRIREIGLACITMNGRR